MTDDGAPTFDREILEVAPILGVCYGMQWIAMMAGSVVADGGKREYGKAAATILEADGLFAGFDRGERTQVWMSHGDHVDRVPPGYQSGGDS